MGQRGPKPPPQQLVKRAAHMACAGKSYAQIAACLGVSQHTVSFWKIGASAETRQAWQDAVDAWPIFDHKLADKTLDADELLHAYCVEKWSLTRIQSELGYKKARVIRLFDYLCIERRQDAVQVKQNTRNALDIKMIIRQYKAGMSLKDLREMYGGSMNTFRRHLIDAGVKIRGVSEARKAKQKRTLTRKRPLKTVARVHVAQVLYTDLHNLIEISSALGISKQAVHYYLSDPLWKVPVRAGYDKGRGFVPYTRTQELLAKYQSTQDRADARGIPNIRHGGTN